MPRRSTACRRVSHCVIYSPGASKMPLHAMGSKNSAYAGASGAHRLAWRPDSVAIITKNGGCSSECPPVLFGESGKIISCFLERTMIYCYYPDLRSLPNMRQGILK